MSDSAPIVSVLITTYAHEPYVEQAIRSAAEQVCDFDIEVLVGEDVSPDGTRAICERLQAEYPSRVRVFAHPQNLGGNGNFDFLWGQSRGRYIAWLEGDDFWTDLSKLQRQVEAMERHPETGLCFHNTVVLNQNTGEFGGLHPGIDEERLLPFAQLVFSNRIMTPSVMYRRGLVDGIPDWVYPLKLGDWPMHLLHAVHGPAVYLPQTMAAYRMHATGGWSNRDYAYRLQGTIGSIEAVARHVPPDLAYLCDRSLDWFRKELELVLLRDELERLTAPAGG